MSKSMFITVGETGNRMEAFIRSHAEKPELTNARFVNVDTEEGICTAIVQNEEGLPFEITLEESMKGIERLYIPFGITDSEEIKAVMKLIRIAIQSGIKAIIPIAFVPSDFTEEKTMAKVIDFKANFPQEFRIVIDTSYSKPDSDDSHNYPAEAALETIESPGSLHVNMNQLIMITPKRDRNIRKMS